VDWGAFGETFVTLLVIMDPAGTAPVFVGLTSRMPPGERQRRRCAPCSPPGC
jgi:multiple antibiotic resistance protein